MKSQVIKIILLTGSFFLSLTVVPGYGQQMKSSPNKTHKTSMNSVEKSRMPLVSPGNAIFGAIHEAIDSLNANPNTDWSKVNIEALRQHLIDMYEFTLNVKVLKQKPLSNGNEVTVEPTNPRAVIALNHVLAMHPKMIKKEAGWNMTYRKKGDKYIIRVTTQNPKDVQKIQALGYIGILAYGSHHQRHHWMMVNGINPLNRE